MFRELCSEENLRRLEINPRLVEPFKAAMGRMDDYFIKKGYDSQRDYSALFEHVLLRPKENSFVRYGDPDKEGGYYEGGRWKRKFVFEVRDGVEREGRTAFLQKNSEDQIENEGYGRIVIGSQVLKKSQVEIERSICHEFIHLLVELYLNDLNPDEIFFNDRGRFIIEALTELLVKEIYPEVESTYEPQVKMINYANILTRNVNKFEKYLRANVDFKGENFNKEIWENFVKHCFLYHEVYRTVVRNAQGNVDAEVPESEKRFLNQRYLETQRYLIQHAVYYRMNDGKPMTVDDFMDFCVAIVNLAPVMDLVWQNKYLGEVRKEYLHTKLGLNEEQSKLVEPILEELPQLLVKQILTPPNKYSARFGNAEIMIEKKSNGTWKVSMGPNQIQDDVPAGCQLLFGALNRPMTEEEKRNPEQQENIMRAVSGVIDLRHEKEGKIIIARAKIGKDGLPSRDLLNSIELDMQDRVEIDLFEREKIDEEIQTKKRLIDSPSLVTDLKVLLSQEGKICRAEKVELPGVEFKIQPATLVYILYFSDGSTAIVDSDGKNIELTDIKENSEVSNLGALVGNKEQFAYQIEKIGKVEEGYIGKVNENKQLMIYKDGDDEVQVAALNGANTFVAKKEVIYDYKKAKLYFPIQSPKEVTDAHKGTIINVQEFEDEKKFAVDQEMLLSLLKGLNPKKRKEAIKTIAELLIEKYRE